jgi:hypothetical protein
MLAGRAHPAGMAAVAEFVIEEAVSLALTPHSHRVQPFVNLAKALKEQFSEEDLRRLSGAVFDPKEDGISQDERNLRTRICAEINEKKAEFDQQLIRLMDIFNMQLELNDSLAADGPAMQEGAINTLSHLEMLTSPTTWVSKHGEVKLNHLEVRPETRVPWRAVVAGDNIVYQCDKPLAAETRALLAPLAQNSGATLETDALGVTRLTVPKASAERVFAAFSEENVQNLTHPEEAAARNIGLDPLKVAKDYKPAPSV